MKSILLLVTISLVINKATTFHLPSTVQPRRFPTRHGIKPSNQSSRDSISYSEASLIRTQHGHDAAIHHYRQLLQHNPQDTSAATHIAAARDAMSCLAKVGWSYSQLNGSQTTTKHTDEEWVKDIEELHNLLERSTYYHYSLRKHIFNLPTGIYEDNGDISVYRQSLEKYKNDYPMGPSYVTPLVAGQGLDISKVIDTPNVGSTTSWLTSLQCLATLFLLSSCIPKHILIESLMGGNESLELLQRLDIVFIFDPNSELSGVGQDKEEWVVPLVHLFPLEIPPMRSLSSDYVNHNVLHNESRKLVLMTDLHPNVLGMTSIPKIKSTSKDEPLEDGAVMYIGPDSLALVHHLHGSMPQYIESRDGNIQPLRILDVCTGSGVQAISTLAMLDTLKENSSHSIGIDPSAVIVDINKRALRFTEFNAHLNGYRDRISTVNADLLSGTVYDECNDVTLVDALLSKSPRKEKQLQYDILLANPPFIPTPSSRSDDAASSLRKESKSKDLSTPRYGLFSSGGASGEDCLYSIVQMTPMLLKSNGGLLALVSEFMNPPLSTSNEEEWGLTSKIESWWSTQADINDVKGVLFTNEFAINSETYAQRRAMKNDEDDINLWKKHMHLSGINEVSPGLLFIETQGSKRRQSGDWLRHNFVPKSSMGSIWTPHNYYAIDFTRRILLDLFW